MCTPSKLTLFYLFCGLTFILKVPLTQFRSKFKILRVWVLEVQWMRQVYTYQLYCMSVINIEA